MYEDQHLKSSYGHNSVIFKAMDLNFCMEVDLDNPQLDLTSILLPEISLTSTSEVKYLK